jgi:hypothetical protein
VADLDGLVAHLAALLVLALLEVDGRHVAVQAHVARVELRRALVVCHRLGKPLGLVGLIPQLLLRHRLPLVGRLLARLRILVHSLGRRRGRRRCGLGGLGLGRLLAPRSMRHERCGAVMHAGPGQHHHDVTIEDTFLEESSSPDRTSTPIASFRTLRMLGLSSFLRSRHRPPP